MSKLLFLIAICIALSNCFAQSIELFGVEYANFPNAQVKDRDSIEANFSEFEISFWAPVFLKEKWSFLVGGNYRLVMPETANQQIDDNLFFLALRLAGAYNFSKNKQLIISIIPAISTTDEPGSFAGNNLLMQGGILFKKQTSERFTYALGVISTSRFGSPLILPSIGLTHAGDNMKLDINLPLLAKMMWNYQNTFSYGWRIAVNGSQYNLNNKSFNGTEVDLARFSRVRLGPEFQYRIKGPLVLTLYGGIAANRTYDFKLIGSDDIDFSLENGPFISFRFSINPQTKNT